jgi:hypothetical protein
MGPLGDPPSGARHRFGAAATATGPVKFPRGEHLPLSRPYPTELAGSHETDRITGASEPGPRRTDD